MIAGGLRARLVCVDTRVLDQRFVGRVFDDSLLDDLPASVDPCGEKGEFHTCVYDGPMFHDLMDLEPGRLESPRAVYVGGSDPVAAASASAPCATADMS